MSASDLAHWFPSCPQLAHPKITLWSPTQWAGQTMGNVYGRNRKGVQSLGLREIGPAVNTLSIWKPGSDRIFSSFCVTLQGNFSLTQLGN